MILIVLRDITIPREMVDIVIESKFFKILWYTMFVDLHMSSTL